MYFMNNSIKMIIFIIKFFFTKIKHLQNQKISSKFEGKSECPHYTQVNHYDKSKLYFRVQLNYSQSFKHLGGSIRTKTATAQRKLLNAAHKKEVNIKYLL